MSRYGHMASKGTSWAIKCSCCSGTSIVQSLPWPDGAAAMCSEPSCASLPPALPLTPFHPTGSWILPFEQTILVSPGFVGFGIFMGFFATLPEIFSSAGKNVGSSTTFPGLLAWRAPLHLTFCLQGREGAGRQRSGQGERQRDREEEEALLCESSKPSAGTSKK